jgi:type II secretory pathway pseudopilin PulG
MGGFNEQALSNAVYAFDKAGLLTAELLSRVFEVSVLRLQRGRHDAAISFKPQELCTLLKACHSNIAPPWNFLATLLLAVDAAPHLVDSWGPAERTELHRARLLFNNYQAEQVAASRAAANNAALLTALGGIQQQQQQQAQQAAVLAAAQQQAAANAQLQGNLAALGAGGAGVSGGMPLRSLPPLSSQQLGSLNLPLGSYGLTSPGGGAPGSMAGSMGLTFLPPAMSMAMAMAAAQHRRPSGTGGQLNGPSLQPLGLQGGPAPGGTPLGPW